jgi:citronellol/citronellal dehydrogenase
MMSRDEPTTQRLSPLERTSALAEKSFADRTVVVSGGGSGIGEAVACLAARLGAQVVICGRKRDKLDRVSESIRTHGLRCESIVLDIRDRSAVDATLADVVERHGGIDLLVNSAGGQFPQDAIDFSEKGWRAVIDTNLTGTFNMMQCAARRWRDSGSPGSIVTVVVSPRGLHQVAHSCAARAGVVAFSEAVAVEWAPLRIRVNCIAPGATESAGWTVYDESVRRRYPQACPLRRAGSPFELAEAALFVGGPGGSFITGQTLHVNGGSNLWGETWTLGKPSYFVEASRAWE